MLEFKTIKIDDIDWYKEIAEKANLEQPRINLDSPFGSNYIWSSFYGIKICRFDDYILKGYFYDDGTTSFAFPLGTGDIEKALRAVEEYSLENNIPLCFGGVTKEQCEIINSVFGGRFNFAGNRDYYEYIYESEALATLKGRRLHSKRNHLKRFEQNYNYSFEPIGSGNKGDALDVARRWCAETSGTESLIHENCAIKKSLEDFEKLGFKGAIIKIDGKPAAMTIGERISDKAFVIHFEKALGGFDGLYTAINCYFARTLTGYTYINREEDMGIEGLRRSKLSYKPAILLEQFEGEENA